jgi:hypothetical protein
MIGDKSDYRKFQGRTEGADLREDLLSLVMQADTSHVVPNETNDSTIAQMPAVLDCGKSVRCFRSRAFQLRTGIVIEWRLYPVH